MGGSRTVSADPSLRGDSDEECWGQGQARWPQKSPKPDLTSAGWMDTCRDACMDAVGRRVPVIAQQEIPNPLILGTVC